MSNLFRHFFSLHCSLWDPLDLLDSLQHHFKKTRNICYEQSQARARHTLPSLELYFQGLVKVTKPAQSEFMTRSTLSWSLTIATGWRHPSTLYTCKTIKERSGRLWQLYFHSTSASSFWQHATLGFTAIHFCIHFASSLHFGRGGWLHPSRSYLSSSRTSLACDVGYWQLLVPIL